MKKIEIIESNNEYINNNILTGESLDLEELKKYVLSKINLEKYSEPEIFFKTLEWVSTRWQHDGLNIGDNFSSYEILKNVEQGKRYRCVEYGKVFADVLSSFGYFSRVLALQSVDVAYGDFGKGHVASEVWSNQLDKWIFFDPQLCIYTKYNEKYLNFYEIYEIYKKEDYDKIDFIISDEYIDNYIEANPNEIKNKNQYIDDYKDFLKNYFGSLSISKKMNNEKFSLVLKMDNKNAFLTFQGQPFGKNIFTENINDIYFKLNQTMVLFDYQEKEKNRIKELEKTLEIKTLEDYTKNRPLFYANPHFNLKLMTNMASFSHYEITINDKNYKIEKNEFELNLEEGLSTIIVKSINKYGISGVPNITKIKYQ